MDASLAALEARLAFDLGCLNYPPRNWVLPTPGVVDAVVIGAGMSGLVAAFALRRRGIANIRILDRAPPGAEGPWVTFARMETLRSPKELIGPAADIPALTFRAWFAAQHGTEAWAALFRIPRPMWMDYLNWYRAVLDLPVENGTEVLAIAPDAGRLRLDLADGGVVVARKVVLATGRAGLGRAAVPRFMDGVPRALWAHSSDPIDFAALAGKRVAVVGAGASAMDNAAEALEHGAAEMRMLIRRARMPRINKLMGIGSPGFTLGFPDLDDAWRWRFMHYAGAEQTPAPRNSTLRVTRHANAHLHFGCAVQAVRTEGRTLRIETARRPFAADFLILGTGFTVEPEIIPELAALAPDILRWSDRYTPPPELADAELGAFPYLAPDFAFVGRHGPSTGLADLHCFNHAATLSLGKISGDIPKVSDGAALLADRIAASLFTRDVEGYFRQAVEYDIPELHGGRVDGRRTGARLMTHRRTLLATIAAGFALPARAEVAGEPVLVGVSGPLTGQYAQYAAQWRKGFDLAVEEANAAGGVRGRPLGYVFEDTQSDPRQAVAVAQKFVGDPRIMIELGDFSSAASMAASPIYQRGKLVQFGFTNSHPDFTKGGDYMWSNAPDQAEDMPSLARWAVDKLGMRRIALVYISGDWGRTSEQLFADAARNSGAAVVATEGYLPNEQDFRSTLVRVRDAAPDGIALIAYYPDGAQVVRQMRQVGLHQPVVAASSIYSPKFLEIGGNATDNVYTDTNFFPEDPRPAVRDFVARFRAKYGSDPDSYNARGYDAMIVCWTVLKKVGPDRAAVRDGLAKLDGVPSVVFGTAHFDPATRRVHDPANAYLMIRGGKFVPWDGKPPAAT